MIIPIFLLQFLLYEVLLKALQIITMALGPEATYKATHVEWATLVKYCQINKINK